MEEEKLWIEIILEHGVDVEHPRSKLVLEHDVNVEQSRTKIMVEHNGVVQSVLTLIFHMFVLYLF
jgi:hypothetical protein